MPRQPSGVIWSPHRNTRQINTDASDWSFDRAETTLNLVIVKNFYNAAVALEVFL